MTYTINGAEFTQKNFREVGNRKTYYIEYGKLVSNAKDIYGHLAMECFDEKGSPQFDVFLKSFLDGDFTKVAELQKTVEGIDELMGITIKVVAGFLSLNQAGGTS